MLIHVHYLDDGFLVEALLTERAEQALTDDELAAYLFRPDGLAWTVPPVLASLPRRARAPLPRDARWRLTRIAASSQMQIDAGGRVQQALQDLPVDQRATESESARLREQWTSPATWECVRIRYFES